jgi:hypothetical protein
MTAHLAADSSGAMDEPESKGLEGSGGGSGSDKAMLSPPCRPRTEEGSVVGGGSNRSLSNGSNSERSGGTVPLLWTKLASTKFSTILKPKTVRISMQPYMLVLLARTNMVALPAVTSGLNGVWDKSGSTGTR